jgi:hypothetical protein
LSSTSDAAQWLEREIGVGGVFTKEQLRAAFPGVTQIDRRVRDLRERGWIIDTRRQDPTLRQTEMRLVTIGTLVRPARAVTSKARREAMLEWGYICCLCGAQGSTFYEDAKHVRVVLNVEEIPGKKGALVPVCLRCSPTIEALAEVELSVDEPVAGAARLTSSEWRRASLLRLLSHLTEPGK